MTQEKLINAITEIDSDILDRYFHMKQSLAEKKKPRKRTWVKWASLAACFAFVFVIGFMVIPMFQKEPHTDDLDDKQVYYTNIQDVEQIVGRNTLMSNIDNIEFDFSAHSLWYDNGKKDAPTKWECELSLGTHKDETLKFSTLIFCYFPHYKDKAENFESLLPSSVLPPDFTDKGETETVVPPMLLTTTVEGVEISYYQYEQGMGFGGLGKFEVNEHIYVVRVYSVNNENMLFEVIRDMLD